MALVDTDARCAMRQLQARTPEPDIKPQVPEVINYCSNGERIDAEEDGDLGSPAVGKWSVDCDRPAGPRYTRMKHTYLEHALLAIRREGGILLALGSQTRVKANAKCRNGFRTVGRACWN
jgi:hypothetical protein